MDREFLGVNLRDLSERALSTFIQTFIALLVASFAADNTVDIDALQAAAVGGLSATLSVLKSVFAARTGTPHTAALYDGDK